MPPVRFVTPPPVSLLDMRLPSPGLLFGDGAITPEGDGFRVTARRKHPLDRQAGTLGALAGLLLGFGTLIALAKFTTLFQGGVFAASAIVGFAAAIAIPRAIRSRLAPIAVDAVLPRGQLVVRAIGTNYLRMPVGKDIGVTVDGYAPDEPIFVLEATAPLKGLFYCRALDEDGHKLLASLQMK
jgi:hypothetical protein